MARAPHARDALRALLAAAAEEWRTTPLYRLALGGPEPDRIAQWGADPRIGDPLHGREMLSGRWRIASERLAEPCETPWSAPPPSPHFAARLHSFSWLGDLAAAEGGRDLVSSVIHAWVQGFGEWHPQAWAPELCAERLFAWLCWGRPAFEGAEIAARPALLRSLGRQTRHLAHTAGEIRDPLSRIKAGAALVLAGAAQLPDAERFLSAGLDLLEEAAAAQFSPEGLHLSRAPEACVEALADFVAADDALVRRGVETPAALRRLMPKLASMIRFLQLGDGGLAAFHGGGAGDRDTIARLLRDFEGEARPYHIAPGSGYSRLIAGDVTIVLDAGASPAPAFGDRGHAGCLAFEMSCGADRLVVNVGSARQLHPEWRAAGRPTNGHATLILDDELSAPFEAKNLARGAARPVGPPNVSAKRTDDEDGARVEARHEGYRAEYGLVHARTLFLDTGGVRVVGLDQLFRPMTDKRSAEATPLPYAIRFHLHPDVLVTRRSDIEVRLETPSGAHWRMRTDTGAIAIEDSVFLSEGPTPRRSRQIVIHGDADPNGAGEAAPNRVIWALIRIDKPAGPTA